MKYAEVAVNAPTAWPRTFTYTLPSDTPISMGTAVWVPFGSRSLQGIVFNLTDYSPVEETREIADIIDPLPLLSEYQIELAKWIAEYYLSSYFDAASLMLPPGFERRTLTLVECLADVPDEALSGLSPVQKRAFDFVQKHGRVDTRQLQKRIPEKQISSTIKQLFSKGLIKKTTALQKERVKPKFVDYVQLNIAPHVAKQEATRLLEAKRAPKKVEVLKFLIDSSEPVTIADIKQNTKCSASVIQNLAKDQLIKKVKVGKTAGVLVDRQRAIGTIDTFGGQKGDTQLGKALLALYNASRSMKVSELFAQSGANSTTIRELGEKGFVSVRSVRISRDPLAHRDFSPSSPPELTSTQETAWNQIRDVIHNLSPKSPSTFLLHGITGSGKTEIYLHALKETIAQGKKGIVLVPEIALTPQTIARFAARFPDRVAVLHSKLSPGEQFDEWHRIRDGEFDVVIGSRSAIFAPQSDLGLIVIDEEHEWTYKQHDKPPLYHARDVALKLAEFTGSTVILGSATPDIESYYHAQKGKFRLLELPERVCEVDGDTSPMLPQMEIIDLRQELKEGNRSVFSRKLSAAMETALAANEQIILFLNRRGAASFVQCRDCGHVVSCRRCEMSLTHHTHEDVLVCHLCNYRMPSPTACPECRSQRIKFLGMGTQKLEEETAKAFPHARILRWDRDVTRSKHSHEEILHRFQSHEADILIGTQMIAKGLDIPLVTLVGVVNADIGLYLPDFRAGERTFQLLSQVTGRAGRGIRGGQAIIQTYTPEHYAIGLAALQDFNSFYEQEIGFRHEHGNPPFNRLVSMIYTHTNAERCEEEAYRMAQVLKEEQDRQGLANMDFVGPSPAYTQRIRGKYRWQLIIRGPDPMVILSKVTIPNGWMVDIDPVGLS